MTISNTQQKVNQSRYSKNFDTIFGRKKRTEKKPIDKNERIISAIKSIRPEYARLISQDRGLIGADTVLDMIDAALNFSE